MSLLSLRYSKLISYILSTTFSVLILSAKCQLLRFYSQSIFIHQNSKRTAVLYISKKLEERPKALLKMLLIDADRVMLPRRPQRRHF